jgi:hypothetical protein
MVAQAGDRVSAVTLFGGLTYTEYAEGIDEPVALRTIGPEYIMNKHPLDALQL